ncbi:PKD domain-containing protein, partial [Geojedonia litorea]
MKTNTFNPNFQRSIICLLFVFFGISNLFSQIIANQPPTMSSPTCSVAGCGSSDVEIGGVYLADAAGNKLSSCTVPDPISSYYLWIEIIKASSKHDLFVQFNLFKDNVKIGLDGLPTSSSLKISSGHDGPIAVDDYRMVPIPIYLCGEVLELRDIYIAWQSPGQAGGLPSCSNSSSKCSGEFLPPLTVNTPLAVDFSTTQSCTNGSFETVVFTNESSGGDGTLSYLWNFGAGASPATANTVGPHTVTYTSAGVKNVSLKVTDADGDNDTHNDTVSVGVCCNLTISNISSTNTTCAGGNDGTVSATISGAYGTATYNLLYSSTSGGSFSDSPATNGDSNGSYTGLPSGYYKVYVTDSNGCNATSSEVYVAPGDNQAPSGSPPTGINNINACASDALASIPSFDPVVAASGYTDNSSAVTATLTSTSAVNGDDCSWSVIYTFKVSDACGNELTGQTITHSGGDKTPPTLTGTIPTGATNQDLCFSDIPAGPSEADIAAQYTD